MPQESPTSLDKQLGSYPHPREESRQLAHGASGALPCALCSEGQTPGLPGPGEGGWNLN